MRAILVCLGHSAYSQIARLRIRARGVPSGIGSEAALPALPALHVSFLPHNGFIRRCPTALQGGDARMPVGLGAQKRRVRAFMDAVTVLHCLSAKRGRSKVEVSIMSRLEVNVLTVGLRIKPLGSVEHSERQLSALYPSIHLYHPKTRQIARSKLLL